MNSNQFKKLNSQGQTLIEVIVLVGVGVLISTALVFAAIASLRNAEFSQNQSQATKLAQEAIEKVRADRNSNQLIRDLGSLGDIRWYDDELWTSNSISRHCNRYCYTTYTDTGDGLLVIGGTNSSPDADSTFPATAERLPKPPGIPKFQRVVVLSESDINPSQEKQVTVIVRWSDATGFHQSKLSTILGKPL